MAIVRIALAVLLTLIGVAAVVVGLILIDSRWLIVLAGLVTAWIGATLVNVSPRAEGDTSTRRRR